MDDTLPPADARARSDEIAGATTRRRFLGQVGAGATVVAGVVTLRSAIVAAQEAGGGNGDADTATLGETLELAAVQVYEAMASSGKLLSPVAIAALADFGRHHAEHANRFRRLAGSKATGNANRRLVRTVTDQLAQAVSEQDVLKIAFDLESALASTHLGTLGSAEKRDLVELTASVLPVEAQHAVVAGRLGGVSPDKSLTAFEDLDLGLDVTQYPATTTTSTTTG